MVLSRLHCNAGRKPRDHGDLGDVEMMFVVAFILAGGQWPGVSASRPDTEHSFYRPPLMVSVMKRAFRNAEFFTPIVEVLPNAIESHINASASIFALSGSSYPDAIERFIWPIIFNSFNCEAGTIRCAHISVEVFKDLPALANLDASTAISEIISISGVVTTTHHRPPAIGDRLIAFDTVIHTSLKLSGSFIAHWHALQIRDVEGKYDNSPLKSWFENLRSAGKELCCSVADGHPVADEDWRIVNEHYQVRIGDEWVTVPDQALVKEQNRAGHAMEWHSYNDGHPRIRCFMPGTMT